MSTRGINGHRLNGELTRAEQRDLRIGHECLISFVTSLTQAIREHADGRTIPERAAAIRQKGGKSLPNSSSQMRRKDKQRDTGRDGRTTI